MKTVSAFVVLWAGLIIESTIFQIPPINALQPNFILVGLIMIALARGPRAAMVLGVSVGLLQDAVFGSFLGLNAFTYGVLGYFAGVAFSQFLHKNVAIAFLITIIATFVQQWFTYGLTRMFDATSFSTRLVMAHSLWQMIQNGILLLLLYPPLWRLFGLKAAHRYTQDSAESR